MGAFAADKLFGESALKRRQKKRRRCARRDDARSRFSGRRLISLTFRAHLQFAADGKSLLHATANTGQEEAAYRRGGDSRAEEA